MSTSKSLATKADALAQMQALITGLQKHYPGGQFKLGSADYTTDQLVALCKSVIDAITKVNAAQASARDDVSAMRAVMASGAPIFRALRYNLRNAFGTLSQTLADFGLEPEKARAPMTGEEMATAAAKAKATREARGTGSKKSKSTVKGNVVGVTVTPNIVVPAPASPAPQQQATATTTEPTPAPSK